MQNLCRISPQGPYLSRMVCGYWRLIEWGMAPQQLLSFIQQHVELGITTTSHANIYGGYQCERAFGEALRLEPSLRNELQLVSKCGIATTAKPEHALSHCNTALEQIISSVETSLINLHTDHLDLLLIDRPDPLMHVDEVVDAFFQLQKSGKVQYFGVSNFTVSQFVLLQSRLPFLLVTNQVEISPWHQPAILDGTLDLCQQQRIQPMVYSCLGGGRLFNDPEFELLRDELHVIAEEIGATTIEQVVYAWVLCLPSLPLPIIGSGNIERVRSIWQSLSLKLNCQQWFRISQATLGYDIP